MAARIFLVHPAESQIRHYLGQLLRLLLLDGPTSTTQRLAAWQSSWCSSLVHIYLCAAPLISSSLLFHRQAMAMWLLAQHCLLTHWLSTYHRLLTSQNPRHVYTYAGWTPAEVFCDSLTPICLLFLCKMHFGDTWCRHWVHYYDVSCSISAWYMLSSLPMLLAFWAVPDWTGHTMIW